MQSALQLAAAVLLGIYPTRKRAAAPTGVGRQWQPDSCGGKITPAEQFPSALNKHPPPPMKAVAEFMEGDR